MIPDEPVRGRYAYLEHPWLLGLSGLEQFRTFLKRQVTFAPLYRLSGLEVTEAGLGSAAFSMPASPWWQTGVGLFPGGSLAFAADAALGGAIFSTLPPASILATSELSINFLRPASVASGTINVRARVVQAGRSQGLSEAQISDAGGRLLAFATSRCVVQPVPFDPPPPPAEELPSLQTDANDAPDDPYLRPPDGVIEAPDPGATGLELSRGWIAGTVPSGPVVHLTGIRGLEADEGSAAMAMPASEWFCTAGRLFYGGALAYLADAIINMALGTILPPRASFGTLDLKVNFLRRVEPDGRELVARGRVVHPGRRIGVTTAEIEDRDGRRVAMAVGSAMIFPDRPWMAEERSTLDESTGDED